MPSLLADPQVEQNGNELRAKLRWTPYQSVLTASNSCIHNVEGLNLMNKRLLIQRGATKEARKYYGENIRVNNVYI